MKNVFLFVASVLMGVATFSQNTWQFNAETNEIQIQYNPYAAYGDEEVSTRWTSGCRSALIDAVKETTGSQDWTPQIGQAFFVRITGIASNTGYINMGIADEREEADYFTNMSKNYFETQVIKGEPFVLEGTFYIDNVTYTQIGKKVEGGLTAGELFLMFAYIGKTADEDFNPEEPFTISDATMEVFFAEKTDIENPLVLTNKKRLENSDSYLYQSLTQSKTTFDDVYSGAFVNVSFTGKALADMEKLSYMLVSYNYKNYQNSLQATTEAVTFAENVQNGDIVNAQFSFPLNKTNFIQYNKDGHIIYSTIGDCIWTESPEKVVALYFENADISVEVTDKPKYQIPDGIITDDDYVVAEDEVIVESERSEALFTMPINEGADSYTLTIKNNGEIVCSLTFNAQGQLANIDFSNTASYELKSDVLAYQFTVTGLTEGTSYGYNFKALDYNKIVLKEYEGEFTTKEGIQTGGDTQGFEECGTHDDKEDFVSTSVSEVSNASSITIANRQILVNEEVPAFVVTVSGQKIANANLKTGMYFVVVDGKTLAVSIR